MQTGRGMHLQLTVYGCDGCIIMMHLWTTATLLAARILRSFRASAGKCTVWLK